MFVFLFVSVFVFIFVYLFALECFLGLMPLMIFSTRGDHCAMCMKSPSPNIHILPLSSSFLLTCLQQSHIVNVAIIVVVVVIIVITTIGRRRRCFRFNLDYSATFSVELDSEAIIMFETS